MTTTNGHAQTVAELFHEAQEARAGPITISFVPQVVNLELYAGDGVSIDLHVTFPDSDDPVDLTGDIAAQIRAARPDPLALLDWTVDMTNAAQGKAGLSLTGAQTMSLMQNGTLAARFRGVWDVEWTPAGAEPVTLLQGDVSCVLDVTRP